MWKIGEHDAVVLAALITAFSAIIAPVITAWINNRHQYRMRKLEMMQAEKIKAVQEYVESCSRYIAHGNSAELADYARSYGRIFLYVGKKHWKKIRAIHHFIDDGNLHAASDALADICQELSGEMKI